METTSNQLPSLEITRRRIPHMHGFLIVHDRLRNGELVDSAFTFDSLTHVLDMPKSTLEGRYARGRLHKWKVEIPNGFGRPARGFPLPLLADVIDIIQTPKAKVATEANRDVVVLEEPVRATSPLQLIYYCGEKYFTIAALADHFGYSETTIRKKLTNAHLMRRLRDLSASLHGGRPRRGFPESALGDIYLAINNGAKFGNSMDAVMARAGGMRAAAQKEMVSAIVPHEPPPPRSLRAWDEDTLAPVVPTAVNGVKSADDDLDLADLDAQLNALMAQSKEVPLETVTEYNAAAQVEPEPSVEATAEEAANRAKMASEYRKELLEQEQEPDVEQYEYVADVLALDKAGAAAFVAEITAARARGAA